MKILYELIKAKIKIETRNLLCKQYTQNGKFESEFLLLETLIPELNKLISSSKSFHYEKLEEKKLNNPLLQAKTYWSFCKTFCKKKNFH